mmetsp:Transcript_6403/g.22891  ORF Transcript_6403/g.22891 Transcript_6403/m.22891 type:complete len:220 (+) Transcript_6403:1929-2588(+)
MTSRKTKIPRPGDGNDQRQDEGGGRVRRGRSAAHHQLLKLQHLVVVEQAGVKESCDLLLHHVDPDEDELLPSISPLALPAVTPAGPDHRLTSLSNSLAILTTSGFDRSPASAGTEPEELFLSPAPWPLPAQSLYPPFFLPLHVNALPLLDPPSFSLLSAPGQFSFAVAAHHRPSGFSEKCAPASHELSNQLQRPCAHQHVTSTGRSGHGWPTRRTPWSG